jgi:hypothetical protein
LGTAIEKGNAMNPLLPRHRSSHLSTFPFIIFLSFLIIVFFTACEEENPCVETDQHLKLGSESAEEVPYTGTDTLKFLHTTDSTHDTLTYIGQGRIYKEVGIERLGMPNCRYTVYREEYTTLYKTNDPLMDIKFTVGAGQGSDEFIIEIHNSVFDDLFWIVNNPSYGGFENQVEFDNQFFYSTSYIGRNGERLYYNSDYGMIHFKLKDRTLTLLK